MKVNYSGISVQFNDSEYKFLKKIITECFKVSKLDSSKLLKLYQSNCDVSSKTYDKDLETALYLLVSIHDSFYYGSNSEFDPYLFSDELRTR